jgi:hypothetical protein
MKEKQIKEKEKKRTRKRDGENNRKNEKQAKKQKVSMLFVEVACSAVSPFVPTLIVTTKKRE